jgi:transcriptional regulator with XRE-family HTH domain
LIVVNTPTPLALIVERARLKNHFERSWHAKVRSAAAHDCGKKQAKTNFLDTMPHRSFGRIGSLRDASYADFAITGGHMAEDINLVVDKHVGNRVRMQRLMVGLSQEALGKALGLTFQQVQKYENGKNRISASRLQHISQILQVPPPFFFDGAPGGVDGAAEIPSYVNEFLATADGVALTKAFVRIEDAKLRRLIVHLVQDCAEL